jgi:hypothetical protein
MGDDWGENFAKRYTQFKKSRIFFMSSGDEWGQAEN